MEAFNQKKTFKDKIKDRISIVKQKSSETFNARSTNTAEKTYNKIEYQNCIQSFLPQLHHENEIEEALLENIVESRVKESSKVKKDQRKQEIDFFINIAKEDKYSSQTKHKQKIKLTPPSQSVSSPEELSEEKKITSNKTALKYFDTEINDQSIVSKLIISKRKTNEDDFLFWDGKECPVQNTSLRNIVDEGFFVGSKPRSKSDHLRKILSNADDQSEWFNSRGELIVEDNPVLELSNEIRYIPSKEVKLLTTFVKPIFFDQNTLNLSQSHSSSKKFGQSVIEFDFNTLKFYHHSLFSIEHVIAQKVIKAYDLYSKKHSEKLLKQQEDLLFSLRRTKLSTQEKILAENDNSQKKLYKDSTYRKYIKEISKVRILRFKEASELRNHEKEILKYWRNIKSIRKNLQYTSTNLVLEIVKQDVSIEEDRNNWEDMFEIEVNDVIDEIKCEYFESRADYINKNKILKRNSPDSANGLASKPRLDYDEIKIRKHLFNKMCEVFRQPGEPIILIKLTNSPGVITESPKPVSEVSRRTDVDKTKIFIKLYLDNKEVCKMKTLPMNPDFSLPINESYSIHVPKEVSNIKFILYEQSSFLPPSVVGEVLMAIPDHNILISEAKIETYSFLIKNKRSFNHSAVGMCNTLTEFIKNKHSDLTIHNIDLEEPFISEGTLSVRVGWTGNTNDLSEQPEPGNSNFRKTILSKEILKAENMSVLCDTELDPNDPKNSFLFTYINSIKNQPPRDKFYFNCFLNFDFLLTRNSKSFDNIKMPDKSIMKILVGNELKLPNDDASTSSLGRPRGSVLDDASVLSKILDPIDLQRRTSIRYLHLVNEHLSLQNKDNNKDKQQSDIVTVFKYPGLRTITVNFLRPKRPLFYQAKQRAISLKSQVDTVRNYTLKICILKAFQLPCRADIVQTGTSTNSEEGGLKMVNLKPFVRVTCQGKSLRTSTAMGNNPTWNERLCFSVKYDSSSVISFHLFDELFEDLLSDNRLEDSTVHCQYSANWLGSMKILLPTVFAQTKIEGAFLMSSPPELLGYKYNLEEKFAHSHVSYDSLRRDINYRQREGFFISMLLEIFPSYVDTTLPLEISETNEMDYMIKYLDTFSENYKNAFPNRKINLLVLDTSGKYICVTRLFKPISLPEFGEQLSTYFSNMSNYEESVSSKNSTPNKKKSSKNQSDDAGTRSTKSVISTHIGDGRRQSKVTKDIIEMRSLDENLTDNGERSLVNKINMCTRFVAMIPLFELNTFTNHSVALTGYQTLRLVCGSMMDHTILLMNYFIHLGIECWFISGLALPRGLSSFVLIKENQHTKEVALKSYTRHTYGKGRHVWKYCIYDATTGIKYDTKDPFCPLQKVFSACNNENIWVNMQAVERCNLIRLDFSSTSDWRAVFQKEGLVACPGPLPGLSGMCREEDGLYTYGGQDVQRLRDAVEDKVRSKVQRWRGHRRTIWNRHCSSILKNSLVHWEKWSLNQSSVKPKNNQKLQQLLLSYQIYGFPYNSTYTSMSDIISAIKGTQIHLDEHSSTEFALGVQVFPYPNRIYSVWVYLASVLKK